MQQIEVQALIALLADAIRCKCGQYATQKMQFGYNLSALICCDDETCRPHDVRASKDLPIAPHVRRFMAYLDKAGANPNHHGPVKKVESIKPERQELNSNSVMSSSRGMYGKALYSDGTRQEFLSNYHYRKDYDIIMDSDGTW